MNDYNNYKIIIFGNKIYREFNLSTDDYPEYKVGTTKKCNIRFNKEFFFDEFEFDISYSPSGWQINCGDSIYFTIDGVMKVYSKDLEYGDEIIVKYYNSNSEIFRINFFINFDIEEKNYERIIDISNTDNISIGGSDKNHIFIQDRLLGNDSITLSYRGGGYMIYDNHTKYGVYVNGHKITDEARLNDYDFFMIVGYSFYIKERKLYTAKLEQLVVNHISYIDTQEQQSAFLYPKFNLNTRIKYVIPDETIDILLPQPLQDPPKKNLILTLIPTLAMLGLTIILRGVIGGGGMFVIYSAATMTLGMIMTVVGVIDSKREYKKKVKERKKKYEAYIKRKEKTIQKLRQKELDILQKIYKPMENNIEDVWDFNKELFEKDIRDEDFLHVRIGTGVVEAQCKVTYNKQDFIDIEDELIEIPENTEQKYRFIQDAPIVSRLTDSNAIGIVGTDDKLYNLLKNITLDISIRHFYKQVKLFYLFDQNDTERFAWIRWLRHVENDTIGVRNFIYDEESKNLLFEHLYIELSKREGVSDPFDTQYIILIFDNKGINKHPISKYIEDCNSYGFTFIFFEDSEDLLPKGCTEIIRLSDYEDKGELLYSKDGKFISRFSYNPVPDIIAEQIAKKLASVYVDDVSLESELTKSISLFELLKIISVDDLDIASRWSESKVYQSMAAPLGVKTKNQIVSLDLNEKHQGPHGLVAGTTGSGKSEILQSYILSMATLFHPYDVGFVIIDFKGGGMVNQFKDLPHLIGSITNIDGREIDRSLLSIKAELRKRQEWFSEYNVNHIDQYIKLFKEGKTSKPLPHLILIVDEFAELKSEYPEFMKELVSAARIGRSLGVHLILATQKPSGVVDEQIWSNSKFKLCLKVQTKQDSNEVIKTPLAAEIKEPGRAYLQVGNNELFELFQSAYSGAPAENQEERNHKEFVINQVELSGKRIPIYVQKRDKNSEKGLTQLEAIVQYINSFCTEHNISGLPGICLPALPDIIRFSELQKPDKNLYCTEIAIGLYDDPSHQLQDLVKLNITQGHTFIVGSAQFGKTNLLQTIVRALGEKYSPSEVNIYILDFASLILKSFAGLNHVGGIITASDDDRLKLFIKMMNHEIAHRKEILSKLGLSSFGSYKEAGYHDLPQFVIIIDNFTSFKELYGEYDDDMLHICREGIAVGISVIIANLQTTSIGYKYLSNFQNRIALNCNDTNEYSNLFDRCRMKPKNVQGRGFIQIDKTVYEYQNFLGFDGEKEIDRVNDMKLFIEKVNSKYLEKAKQIPELPRVLTLEHINNNYSMNSLKPYEVPYSLDYEQVELMTINLLKVGTLLITGREKSGKTNFIKIIFDYFQKHLFTYPVKAYIIDNSERQLKAFENFGFVEKYSIALSDLEEAINEVYYELQDRNDDLIHNAPEILDNKPLLLVIIQNQDALEYMNSNKELIEQYKKIVKQYKALKICFIFSDVEDVAIAYNSPEIFKLLKENRKGLIFNDLSNHKLFEIPLNIQRDYKKPIEVGDAYVVSNNDISKVKTINHG